MANYNEIFVSNAFKTKDNKKARDVLKDLFEDTYIDNQDRVIFGQLNGDAIFDLYEILLFKGDELIASYTEGFDDKEDYIAEGEDESEYKEITLLEFLQDMLLEGEHIVVTVIGWEKLRYIAGCTFVIDKNNCLSKGLEECKQDLFRKLGIKQ